MAKIAKPAAPDQLTMTLFAPGMTALHRAGLGGLTCTLKAMEQQYEGGLLRADTLPGQVLDGIYPWDITDDSVTLKFGRPEAAGAYLKQLFAFGFAITKSGLIHLPGQHHTKPSDAILADLQRGFTLTFLQHGGVRTLAKEASLVGYNLDGDGEPTLVVEYKRCSGFKHQRGWEQLVDKNGRLVTADVKVDGPISPWNRHSARPVYRRYGSKRSSRTDLAAVFRAGRVSVTAGKPRGGSAHRTQCRELERVPVRPPGDDSFHAVRLPDRERGRRSVSCAGAPPREPQTRGRNRRACAAIDGRVRDPGLRRDDIHSHGVGEPAEIARRYDAHPSGCRRQTGPISTGRVPPPPQDRVQDRPHVSRPGETEDDHRASRVVSGGQRCPPARRREPRVRTHVVRGVHEAHDHKQSGDG